MYTILRFKIKVYKLFGDNDQKKKKNLMMDEGTR